MMSCPSRSEAWERVRSLENLLAAVASLDERRRVIRLQAWNEGDWGTVYAEATAMGETLGFLRRELRETWDLLYGEARGDAHS